MGQAGRTGKRLEMEAAKAVYYTVVVDDIDLLVACIECVCSVYFQHNDPMLPHCHLGIVVCQTAHPMVPYWLSSVEIHSLTLFMNKRWC